MLVDLSDTSAGMLECCVSLQVLGLVVNGTRIIDPNRGLEVLKASNASA